MNITIPRETVQQAIDALERVSQVDDDCDILSPSLCDAVTAAITALRTALEAPNPPHECKTEAEKTAFAFGWWKALEANRAAPAARGPLTDEQIYEIAERYEVNYRIPAGCALLFAREVLEAHGIGTQRGGV